MPLGPKVIKAECFLSQSTDAGGAGGTLEPEQATNVEIGARTEWFDNRFRLNVTYFDMEVVDLQLFRLVDHALVSENASIESSGTEVEFAVAVSDNFFCDRNTLYFGRRICWRDL